METVEKLDKQSEERDKLGGEINFMQQHKFEELVEVLDLTKSQRRNVNSLIDHINREKDRGMISESKAVVFGIPSKIGSEVWITVRDVTTNGSMLCLTDGWYTVKFGRCGKVEIDNSRWDKPKDSFMYLF